MKIKVVTPNFVLCLFLLLTLLQVKGQEFLETEIDIGEFTSGTLLTPAVATKKLAIIIAGSGPTDRNGNSQLTKNNSLKLLAENISDQGIATYRYDKRVVTMIKKRSGKISEVLFDDLVTDATNVIAHFRDEGTYDSIYVIGHSQGSLVALLAAQKEAVDGLISLAGPSQPIDISIIEQVSAQMPNFEEELRNNFETLKRTGTLEEYNPLLASIFNKDVQPYLLSWIKYNPSDEIKNITVPVNLINGTKDFQVNEIEAQRLLEAHPEAEITIIKNMNHILRLIDTEDLLVNQKSYQEPATPIAQELVETIVTFISKN